MDLKSTRKDYTKGKLDVAGTPDDPFLLLGQWIEEALGSGIEDANAMCLSTCGHDGLPSARFVLLKGFDENGLVFFTNYNSRKGRQLEENPYAALTFYWKELERQLRVEGHVEKVGEAVSDEYFYSRPLESRINAVISPQSSIIPGREILDELHASKLKDADADQVKRPGYWGGYLVIPSYFEFWQGRPNRLHDRICYKRMPNGWEKYCLAP